MLKSFLASVTLAATLVAGGAHAQETLKIGVLVTLSGAGATWGNAMKGAAELAAADVNADGGLEVGGKNYEVDLVAYDDQYKSSEAITAMNRLIAEDRVDVVMGPMGSAPAVALMPMTSEAGIITQTMAFTDKAMNEDTPYSFRPVLPSSLFSGPQTAWVVKELGITKIAGLYPNDETGQALAKDNEAAYVANGASLAKEMFERERTDFTPLLLRVMATDVEAIELNGNSPQTAALIVRQARELGWDKPIVRTGGDATADILAVAGAEYAEGLYVHMPVDQSKPEMRAFIDRWEETYATSMNGFTPFFYTSMHMVFEGMRRAGTVEDTDAIIAAMQELEDFDSVLGPVNWTGREKYGINHQINVPFYIGRIRDGEPVAIATCDTERCE